MEPLQIDAIFSAGHRIPPGQDNDGCGSHMHGHDFQVLVTVGAMRVDRPEAEIDRALAEINVRSWIVDNLDCGFLIWRQDESMTSVILRVPGQKHWVMSQPPNSEAIAAELLKELGALLKPMSASIEEVQLISGRGRKVCLTPGELAETDG